MIFESRQCFSGFNTTIGTDCVAVVFRRVVSTALFTRNTRSAAGDARGIGTVMPSVAIGFLVEPKIGSDGSISESDSIGVPYAGVDGTEAAVNLKLPSLIWAFCASVRSLFVSVFRFRTSAATASLFSNGRRWRERLPRRSFDGFAGALNAGGGASAQIVSTQTVSTQFVSVVVIGISTGARSGCDEVFDSDGWGWSWGSTFSDRLPAGSFGSTKTTTETLVDGVISETLGEISRASFDDFDGAGSFGTVVGVGRTSTTTTEMPPFLSTSSASRCSAARSWAAGSEEARGRIEEEGIETVTVGCPLAAPETPASSIVAIDFLDSSIVGSIERTETSSDERNRFVSAARSVSQRVSIASGRMITESIAGGGMITESIAGGGIIAESIAGGGIIAESIASDGMIVVSIAGGGMIAESITNDGAIVVSTAIDETAIELTAGERLIVALTIGGRAVVALTIGGRAIVASIAIGGAIVAFAVS